MSDLFQSIKFRLLAVGVLLTLAGVFFRLAFSLPYLQEQVRDLVASQQLSLANYVARDIDYALSARIRLIETLADDFPRHLLQKPEQLQAWLRGRQHLNPLFNSGLLVVPPSGDGLLSEYPVLGGRARLGFADSDWFRKSLRTAGVAIGKPTHGRVDGDPLVIMARAVRDDAGRVVAVIAGVSVLNAPGFLDRLQDTKLGNSGGFLLVSPEDKEFVFASDPDMVLMPLPKPGVNHLHDRAMAGYRGTGVTINAKGVEELSAIVSIPSTGWFVVARIPTEEAFRPVDSLRGMIIRNSALTLSVVIIILLVLLPRMLGPLTLAARAIRKMADGSAPLTPLPVKRNDEVGSLVSGFNLLVARLLAKDAALRASEQRLEFLAHHDPLTGLPNRSMLEDRLDLALARAERDSTQVALLFCDLDGFKPINDLHGHQLGDEVLREVARRLGDGRRRSDTVARIGGDEFVILLSDLEDARLAAQAVAEQSLVSVSRPYDIQGLTLNLGVSIGIAVYTGKSVTPKHLLSQADMAMYLAKRAGKGQIAYAETV